MTRENDKWNCRREADCFKVRREAVSADAEGGHVSA